MINKDVGEENRTNIECQKKATKKIESIKFESSNFGQNKNSGRQCKV